MNIDSDIRSGIVAIGKQYPEIKKIVLFGSRARGDNNERSDVDLAIYLSCDAPLCVAGFCDDLEEMDTLLKFDVVVVDARLKPEMVENISREGIALMGKLSDKLFDFTNAVKRLEESLQEYEQTHSTSVRDGAIQRFEFCTELAWKTTREYLIDQAFINLNSPKAVMKQAFAIGLVFDEKIWLQILNDRNATSHIYKEELADEIFSRITNLYYEEFKTLACKLSGDQ